MLLTLLLLSTTSCADILDLHRASLSGACASSRECAPGESCEEGFCLSSKCEQGKKRCHGLTAFQCGSDNTWQRQRCDAMCKDGSCDTPKSCANQQLTCADGATCCAAIEIKPAKFELRYTYPDPTSQSMQLAPASTTRKVRRYALDRFEVTIGRFGQFVGAYDTIPEPKQGDGAHPAFPDSGWQPKWGESADRYPGSQFALEGSIRRFVDDIGVDADPLPPIRGINWYVALAFCIWDGGRLPTEAEWAYAAFGGDEYRDFPWKSDLALISHELAQYDSEAPSHVGEHSAGQGAFKHEDLAGNVEEWVADHYQVRLPNTCEQGADPTHDPAECLELEGTEHRVTRGGSYRDTGDRLRNTYRSHEVAERAQQWIGFRCARDLED